MSSREIVFAAAGASGPATYIEDVFSTYLYTGDGGLQSINNGIDLAGKGGMVWCKGRTGTYSTRNHVLADTVRGATKLLFSNTTDAQATGNDIYAFNSNGFDVVDTANRYANGGSTNYASWTFRKQPKFFDVVTYTGNGVNGRTIAHSLGSVPGMIIVKRTSSTQDWVVWHRSLTAGNTLFLNYNVAASYNADIFTTTSPTSSVFSVGFDATTNTSGQTYVAYLFAHNAGGFGTSGTDNVISCGTYTTDGSGSATVNLGYEPQWILTKGVSGTGGATDWQIGDSMRGMPAPGSNINGLFPNSSRAEDAAVDRCANPTSTGFVAQNQYASTTYIYMAIRRPMKVPTDATTVFSLATRTGTGSTASITGLTSTPDALLCASRDGWSSPVFADRLRGFGPTLVTVSTSAEGSASNNLTAMGNTSITFGADSSQGYMNWSGKPYVNWMFSRRPGFFDEVCYTGTGSARTVTHNLGVVPELMIVKSRSTSELWAVYSSSTGNTNFLRLNTTAAIQSTATMWDSTTPTSSVFSTANNTINASGVTHVAYLFATCPGVSKVGSYTGTGATQTINCGFTGGARFVLIKRTDSTGDWYVWDTARGMVSGTDPSLLLNSTAAEVNANSVYTATTGFQIVSTAAGINASGGSYIFLAIA